MAIGDRIPIQLSARSRITAMLAPTCDVRTMLVDQMRLKDLMPLLTLRDRWRFAAHRAGGRGGGVGHCSGMKTSVRLFWGPFSGH
jgi:hypothetical protein